MTLTVEAEVFESWEAMPPSVFVALVNTLDECKTDLVLSAIMNWTEVRFSRGEFEHVSEALRMVSRGSARVLACFLSVTFMRRHELGQSRREFVERVRPLIAAEIGSERCENILMRLGNPDDD